MSFEYKRIYKGPLKAAVHDWAGTVIDHGCRAPAAVFQEIFRTKGIVVTESEARGPMGLPKWDHIKMIGQLASVNAQWKDKFGRDFTDQDIDDLYDEFLPLQIKIISQYNDMIPGAVETLNTLRQKGMKIGSCTGYTPDILEGCLKAAKKAGYEPDAVFCAGDVPTGRPGPALLLANMIKLDVYPPEAVVKIGDTVADIDEGLNAGTWVIAVAARGNEVGLSCEDFETMPREEVEPKIKAAKQKLAAGGAHYVVDSIADVPAIVEDINNRLLQGQKP
ncbi:MAG: phosphonoacetaldehyde hydrolase [Methylocystaceae bacterium]|nr:phosphonoacetaldehyde hydrolase [Methylocystaceae bacterium]